jgi:hypothetical protein
LALRAAEPQVERGQPNVVVDTLGVLFSIPSKVILWNLSVDSHQVSTNTEAELMAYLDRNSLTNVKVRINEYAPGDEWSRLVRNDRVGWGWRYTIGLLSWAGYTLLPQRILGGDNYSVWTDTVSIYSDHPGIAIHEGGHAKDFAQKHHPGLYGFIYAFPFVALRHEAVASSDALSYLREHGTAEDEQAAYKVLYPAYTTYIGGGVSEYLLPQSWVYFAAVIPGHVVGRVKAAGVPEAREERADRVNEP